MHLFVGLSRNLYGFRVGHFSSQTNLIDLKSFYLTQPIAISVVCVALLLRLYFWLSLMTLFMTQPNLAKRRFLGKFRSQSTIQVCKNYFVTVFSVFSKQAESKQTLITNPTNKGHFRLG